MKGELLRCRWPLAPGLFIAFREIRVGVVIDTLPICADTESVRRSSSGRLRPERNVIAPEANSQPHFHSSWDHQADQNRSTIPVW